MERKKASFLGKLLTSKGLTGVHHATVLEYENDDELREAGANFRAYLSILREWDEKKNVRIRGILTTEARNLN
ncbi:unnamed protein product [marine sediment metagenome]|uniref:Uncharacterized protein n=1 Tax=marine sediment metagenome TaxID=412755 RepID=X0UI58_9ZZZZ